MAKSKHEHYDSQESVVRKPTPKSLKWHRIHIRKLERRKRKRRKRAQRASANRRRSASSSRRFYHHIIPCPENLSLEENFDGVTKLISDIRERASSRQRNQSTYIAFENIQCLTPSGALVIAAELDRLNHLPWQRTMTMNSPTVDHWNPRVRRLLNDMGFFDLLRILPPSHDSPQSGERYVKFRSGSSVDGEVIDTLRADDLAPHITVPNAKLLFSAVTEAMTNVKHHAYENRPIYDEGPPHWWLSAAYDTHANTLTVMLYDQGHGIPRTLPKTRPEELRSILAGHLFDNDARLIEAAHNLRRSTTNDWHRGRGLNRDVRRYIEVFGGRGMYRVISGRGEYTVSSGESRTSNLRTFKNSLEGTFIQWAMQL